jgi:hypothetical protein
MTKTLLTLTLVLLFPVVLLADKKKEARKPHPLAPSLPQLTDEEEEAIERIIDRFILFDTGRLRGADGKQALKDFQALGPEAIFVLIRGLNKAAKIDASCPALTIGRKVAGILRASSDLQLLEFARENIGAGVDRTRHAGILRDLRVACMVRKRVVAFNNPASGGKKVIKPVRSMSVSELAAAVSRERGPRLKVLLGELAQRKGDEVSKVIKKKLKDERVAVRAAAAQVAGMERHHLGGELIGLLSDQSAEVRKAAHQSLVKLNGGTDLGPKPDASSLEREQAVKKWRDWWDKQQSR